MKVLLAKPLVTTTKPGPPVEPRSRSAVEHVEVGPGGDGQRLDNFLQARWRAAPRSLLHRIVRTGQVRVNGARCKPDQRLALGDKVRLPPLERDSHGDGPRLQSATAARPLPAQDLVVVHEDDDLLVLDKPAGLAVHGGSGIEAGLIERLRASRPGAPFLELAHRLDRDTSGLLIIGKRRPALLALHRMMAEGRIGKRYRAIVKGYWGREHPTDLAFPLERLLTTEGERRVRVSPAGQSALTRVRLLARHEAPRRPGYPPYFSHLECELLTGRTHQIRVHLNHAGFPLLGDQKYGDFTLNKILQKDGHKRMFLHAYSLSMEHPISGRKLRLTAALPHDFNLIEQAPGGDR